jgi:divalent metal cation (Fe/Co/Zn/Cd) transporter
MIRDNDSITPEQRNKESAVYWAIVLDLSCFCFMLGVGLFSGSMTVISEITRFLLLLIIEIVSYSVLRRAHRGRFHEYEFGTGKIERIVNLLVAFGLGITCLYIFSKIVSMGDDVPLSLLNLFLFVFPADFNLAINVWFTLSFIRVNQQENSIIIQSQIKSRIAKTVSSLIVLVILIFALCLQDPKSARIVDIIGSIFILCFMLVIAVDLLKESMPEILDRSVPDPDQHQILRVLTKHFDQYDGFGGYRTRRSGKDLFITITLGFFAQTTVAEIQFRLEPILRDMESEIPNSIVTVVSEVVDNRGRLLPMGEGMHCQETLIKNHISRNAEILEVTFELDDFPEIRQVEAVKAERI